MIKPFALAGIAALLAAPVLAQAVVETPSGAVVVVPAPPPGVVTRQSGATGDGYAGTYSPTGRPEDAVTTDSAAGSNAGQPERIGSTGGSGGK